MVNGLRGFGLVLAAVAVGAAVGLVILRSDDDQVENPVAAGSRDEPTMAVSTSITPRAHMFGDRVAAEVEMLFDSRRVKPDSVQVNADFAPYDQLGPPQRLRADGDGVVKLRYRYALRCVAPSCAPQGARKDVIFSVGEVVYSHTGLQQRIRETFDWPPIELASRLRPVDLEEARWRADVNDLPPVSYRARPGLLGFLLAGTAGLLALAGLALGALLLPRWTPLVAEEEAPPELSPLERALEAVRHTSANGATPEQRKALERLARELGRAGLVDFAGRARRLAWSAQRPERAAVERFQDEVEDEVRRQL
jgi:hypothetical protein